MSEIHLVNQVVPSVPATGKIKLFTDEADDRVKQIDSLGVIKDLTDSSIPVDNCRVGFADYSDLATASTPIIVLAADTDVPLTNDEQGAQTLKTFLPIGITDVWDADNDVFDWTELKLGDMVDLRLDVQIITVSLNTQIQIDLALGSGLGAFKIPFIPEVNFKATGTHGLNRFNGIFMGNANVLDNGGQFVINTDQDCTVIVNGWYCKVLVRG